MVMQSMLAGSFYPGLESHLREAITSYLDNIPESNLDSDILGIISPHAGYYYSGQCAAYGFKAVLQKQFDLAVIIAPSHRHSGFSFTLGDFEGYNTPLGMLEVDKNIVEKLLKYEGFCNVNEPFKGENSLEIQLPFLQVINPKTKILPILMGNQNLENSKYLASVLNDTISDRLNKTIIIASSDLSHYYQSEIAEKMDQYLIELLQTRNLDKLINNIIEHKIEACGFGPIMSLIAMADLSGFTKTNILDYTHSGKISGDNNQVVGYMSAAFVK